MRKKMFMSVAIILVMVTLLNCIAPVLKVAADTDTKIYFESNLYLAIKAELQRQGITAVYNDAQRTLIINDEELAKVTNLSLSNSSISDLTGLENFTNLKSLDLSSNELDSRSNLDVLNSLQLSILDLSSNAIDDVSMVTNINDIEVLNLHNQKFDIVEVIDVDTNENSNQYNGIVYPLPKIITDNIDYIQSEWLVEKNFSNNSLESSSFTPYIDWRSFDHKNLKVVYATKTDISYIVHYGMVQVSIKITDSTSKLYNSDINLYFVTADSNERGIHIKDQNMYNAIKKQLTRGQKENSELISYGTDEGSRNIYNRYFNDPQVLVISIDDIINKIPSLKLSNKRIKNVSGLEKFVGLETTLDLSGNYIRSFDSLVELEKNQEVEEGLLKGRVTAQRALVSETVSKIDNLKAQIKAIQDQIDKATTSFDEKVKQLQKELAELNAQKDKLAQEASELEAKVAPLQAEIDSLKQELEDSTKVQKQLNDQLLAAQKELAKLENADQPIREEIEAKKAEIEELEGEIEAVKTRIDEIPAEVTNKELVISGYQEAIATNQVRLSEIEVEIAKTAEDAVELETLQAEKAKFEEELKKLATDLAVVEEGKSDLEKEKETLKEDLADKQTSLEMLKADLAAKEEELKNSPTGAEAKAIEEQIEELKAQIETEEKTISIIKERMTVVDKDLQVEKGKLDAKNAELKSIQDQIDAKIKEIEKLAEEVNGEAITNLRMQLNDLQIELSKQMSILYSRLDRLYTIYNKIDRLASFAVVGIRTITDEEFYDLTFEKSKSLFNEQVNKIKQIEDYLTSFETSYLIDTYGIPTEKTVEIEKVVVNPDGTTSKVTEIKSEPIEKPISKYFSELADDSWTVLDYKRWLKDFKKDDIYFAMYASCYFTRLFDNLTKCVADKYADHMILRLEIDGQSTDMYEEAKREYQSVLNRFSVACSGKATSEYVYNYAKRITLASGAEISAYVYLPRLKVLDVRENLLQNIDSLAGFTKLVRFYAGDNEIVNISRVDWASVNEHLRVLDLSLNNISEIEPLEALSNIVELDLSKNLIAGELTFKVEKLENLKVLDLNYNQITDIQRLINWLIYEARAYGYNGDIASFLRETEIFNVNFKFQQLEMVIDDVLSIGGTKRVELPKIFRQIEEIDYANTSFAIDSLRGNVTSDGRYVILDTTSEGKHNAEVSIKNTKTTSSFGYGTTCLITYKVGNVNVFEVKVTPETVSVEKGKTQQFEAELIGANVQYNKVTWKLFGSSSEETTISENGLLTVAPDEKSEELVIVATSLYDDVTNGEAIVTVIEPKEEEPETPTEPEEPETPTNPEESENDEEKDKTNEDLLGVLDPSQGSENIGVDPTTPPDREIIDLTPVKPTEEDKTPTANLKLGYKLEKSVLTDVKTKTTVEDFKSKLVTNKNYDVVVTASGKEVTNGYTATGMIARVQDKNGNTVKDTKGNLMVYEIVVKGDVNGDGYADSLDSVLIKAYRSEVRNLTGVFFKAADIDGDKTVDIKDSKLLLYHRAEVGGYNLDYTK